MDHVNIDVDTLGCEIMVVKNCSIRTESNFNLKN